MVVRFAVHALQDTPRRTPATFVNAACCTIRAMAQERVFSEQEVGQIIRRAVEIAEEGSGQAYTPGVTRPELEKIAAEVGVSPEALARAILEAGDRSGKKGPLHLTEEFERVVDGELDPGQFDILLEGVKPFSRAGQPGVAQVGRSFSMSTTTGVGQAKVDVTSRNGRTKLNVKSNALIQGIMTMFPSLIATVITVGALSEQGMGLVGAAIGIGVMTLGTLLFAKLTKVGHRNAERLADDLRDRIASTVASQGAVQQGQAKSDAALEQRLGSAQQ